MFEQHPVPQQISSYQFRLVGDMTLKQFFQLAGGALVGLLFYASPLPSIFKWPLIIFAVVSGAAFAFLPLQERPLSEWLAAFFRAIYGPTLFTWQKGNSKTVYFATTQGAPLTNGVTPVGATNIQDASVAKLEASENKFLSGLGNLFGLAPKPTITTDPTQNLVAPQPTLPVTKQQEEPAVPQARVLSVEPVTQQSNVTTTTTQTAPTSAPGTVFVATPQLPKVRVETQNKGFSTNEVTTPTSMETSVIAPSFSNAQGPVNVQKAEFAEAAAPPMPSTMPNIIVGQILDNAGKIVDSAIMEVKDFQGHPVRALKTNKLGHFMIVTPLPSGTYSLIVEKEGLQFEPVSVEVHGTIIPPISIKAK